MSLQQELDKLIPPQENPEAYNIFRALCKESDEVQLHSRFIASLLDPRPDNPLQLGSKPLELFLQAIGSQFQVGSETELTPGWSSDNWTEDKEIDILIEDKQQRHAIIIENKIYASDSNHGDLGGQLERYHRYMTQNKSIKERDFKYDAKNVEVYYLTLDGHKPSKESLGNGYLQVADSHGANTVHLIQYRMEICEWLKQLLALDEVHSRPYVQTALEQYRNLIDQLAGDIALHKTLTQLVAQHPQEAWEILQNGDANNLLVQKKKDVLWHGMVDFLNELEAVLRSAGLEIEEHPQELYEYVTDLVFGRKKSDTIYFRIPDKRGYVWTLQPDSHVGNFFFGVDTTTNKNRPEINDNEDGGWFCRIYMPEPHINLDNPMEQTSFDNIFIPEKRSKVIQAYTDQVKQLVQSN